MGWEEPGVWEGASVGSFKKVGYGEGGEREREKGGRGQRPGGGGM
jgi:hypothetical protein